MVDGSKPIEIDQPETQELLVDLYQDSGEAVEIDLNQLLSVPENVGLRLLSSLKAKPRSWLLVAAEYVRVGRVETAEELLAFAIENNFSNPNVPSQSGLIDAISMQAYLLLLRARTAPKLILPEAQQDQLPPSMIPASTYYGQAAELFRRADTMLDGLRRSGNQAEMSKGRLGLSLGKALLALARRDFPTADNILKQAHHSRPTNLLVLLLLARLYLQTRRTDQALKTYQQILQYAPSFGTPSFNQSMKRRGTSGGEVQGLVLEGEEEGMGMDPRVGLGLCFSILGDHRRGKLAWNRAIALNPKNRAARFFLALGDWNESKTVGIKEDEDGRKKWVEAVRNFGQLFAESKGRVVPATLGIVKNAEVQGQMSRAIKLTERAIQYADTVAHLRKAISERCRLAYLSNDPSSVEAYSSKLGTDSMPDPVVEIIRAQQFIKLGLAFYREALNVVDIAIGKMEKTAPNELRLLHALLLAFPHPGMSSGELVSNARRARDIMNRIHEAYKTAKTGGRAHELRAIADDPVVFIQLAKMWQTDGNVEKAIEAYQTAIEIYTRIQGEKKDVDSKKTVDVDVTSRDLSGLRMSNNLGALYLGQGNVDEAMRMFEQLLSQLGEVEGEEEEILQAVLLYNLGRAYEESKESEKAIEAYRGLLAKHPEHLLGKIRLSSLLYTEGKTSEEDALLKEANAGHAKDPLLRAYITHYLVRNEKWKDASEYASQTRRGNQDDVHALCALGAYHYHLARESKGSEAERTRDYCRSGEAFSRALEVDPKCAVAAQGLAIAIAEDHLPLRRAGQNGDAAVVRNRGLDVALSIFTRIRDCMGGKSVSINMGHIYANKGDEEKAIETYSAASDMANGQDTSILLFLARTYYQLGSKQQSFLPMTKALEHCVNALEIKPEDTIILHNMAMIQQKSAEIVLGLDPSKRSLQEVEQVIEQAQKSTETFRTLADTPDRPLPYDADLVEQRSRYGEGLLRRAEDQKQKQLLWESEQAERHAEAVRRRQEEKRKMEMVEEMRRKDEQARRDEQAQIREKNRLEAQTWREELQRQRDEEERARTERAEQKEGRKARKPKKDKTEDGFISDGLGEEDVKPKKRGRKKAADPDDSAAESRSQSRSRSRQPKPKKKRPVAVDPDGDDAVVPEKPAKRGKFKSKEFIESDSE